MTDSNEDRRPLLRPSVVRNRCQSILLSIGILTVLMAIVLPGVVYWSNKSYWTGDSKVNSRSPWLRNYISDSPMIKFVSNAVSADNPTCSELGARVLNSWDGNAADAAVAAILCVGVTNFHSAGIGGGSFFLLYNSRSGETHTLDYRECASRHASRDMFNPPVAANASFFGGLSIGVPGEIGGLIEINRKFGKLPWKQLVTPIVNLLRNGHPVSGPLSEAMHRMWPIVSEVKKSSPFNQLRNWLLNPNTGAVYNEGELLKDARLADTFARLANNPDEFYTGELANDIVKELKMAGSIIDAKDLSDYKPVARQPISVAMRHSGLTVHSLPPPSSGAVLGFALRLLDNYRMSDTIIKYSLDNYVTFLHRIIETLKFGFALRSWLGDPDFVDVSEAVTNLTSFKFAEYIRSRIDDNRTYNVKYYGPSFSWPKEKGTAHLSIVDNYGNAVAITSTINSYFGSLIRGSRTGIIYNNEMADFSLPNTTSQFTGQPPSPFNLIEPLKRPMSTMTPVVLTDTGSGAIRFVTGGAGGTHILSAVLHTLARQIWMNDTVKESVDSYRLHHQLVPNFIVINKRHCRVLPTSVINELKRRGHKFNSTDELTVVEPIQVTDSGIYACSDYRKESRPDGE